MRYIFSGGECTRFTESSHRNLFYWEKIRKFSIFRLFFQKQKRRSMTFVFFIILERSYLVQIHSFWKTVHEFFVHNIFVAIGSLE